MVDPVIASKFDSHSVRHLVEAAEVVGIITDILTVLGCDGSVAGAIAEYLANASLCGIESQEVMEILQSA